MTVRELINELLDCNMDDEIKTYVQDPHEGEHGKSEGYLFDIIRVNKGGHPEIEFFD